MRASLANIYREFRKRAFTERSTYPTFDRRFLVPLNARRHKTKGPGVTRAFLFKSDFDHCLPSPMTTVLSVIAGRNDGPNSFSAGFATWASNAA